MPRPKTILWVDDEVEGLAAHRRFLEAQGFSIASAAHGDDALALLRRQSYSIVLLDEQMPGRRGLELIGEIRAIDAGVPVVMVTQSEDEGTLREAIGIEVDDYLVKPVQPRQILSVVTRLLEGDRIRQQRLARDFVTRFRELEGRRGATLAWREWIELVAELARWEVRLAAANEPGLSEALRALQRSLRKDFAEYVARQYPRWLAAPEGDRPPLSVDVGAEFLVPVLKAEGRALFVVVDCLRLDQWEVLRDLVTPLFDVEESHYYSILPTATPFARNAIFSGMFPMEIAARHPGWWGQPSDEESLNAHEGELLAEQLGELTGRPVAVRYEKLFSSGEGDLVRRLPAHLSQDGVTALVFNFVDQLTHGRSESAILYEVARDEAALRRVVPARRRDAGGGDPPSRAAHAARSRAHGGRAGGRGRGALNEPQHPAAAAAPSVYTPVHRQPRYHRRRLGARWRHLRPLDPVSPDAVRPTGAVCERGFSGRAGVGEDRRPALCRRRAPNGSTQRRPRAARHAAAQERPHLRGGALERGHPGERGTRPADAALRPPADAPARVLPADARRAAPGPRDQRHRPGEDGDHRGARVAVAEREPHRRLRRDPGRPVVAPDAGGAGVRARPGAHRAADGREGAPPLAGAGRPARRAHQPRERARGLDQAGPGVCRGALRVRPVSPARRPLSQGRAAGTALRPAHESSQ